MIARALRRLGWSVVVLWAVVTITFLVSYALPGDPARVVAGQQARPADVARIRKQLALDRPLAVQYALFLKRLVHVGPTVVDKKDKEHASCSTFGPVHVDLGMSYQQRKPVLALIGDRMPATLLLAFAAMFVQIAVGIAAGTIAAFRRGTLVDRSIVLATLFGVSTPTFLSGVLLQYVFAYRLRLLPFDGFGQSATERVSHVILPAITLGLFGAAYYARLVRDEVLVERDRDYVRTARAKGAGELRVAMHVVRNTLLPLVTVVGMDLGTLVGGAVVTERLFRWPGLGRLSVDAVVERDGPVILGTVIVAAAAVVVASLVVDLSYALLDPRVRRPT